MISQNKKIPKPQKPSMFLTLLYNIGGIKLLLAFIFLVLSVGFQICQPLLMKEVLKHVTLKVMSPDEANFPYSHAIILMISPFFSSLFDTLQSRLIYHISSSLRSGLAGMIYHKVLKMNLSSQSNANTGRVISLLSADTNQMAMMFPMFFQMFALPVQIIIPMIFVIIDWAVVLITFPIQGMLSTNMQKAMRAYLQFNDDRNKITNEVLQGIRVVKYSGLEAVFIDRVEEVRESQLGAVFKFTLLHQSLISIMRCAPIFVNASSMSVFVSSRHITQVEFPVKVQSNIGFLLMMTQPFSFLAMYIMSAVMVMVSQTRVRDFLILPELKIVEQRPSDDESIAVEVKDGQFIWGDPPEIPMTKQDMMKLESEAKKRKKDNLDQNDKSINQEMKVSDEYGQQQQQQKQQLIEYSPSPSSSPYPTPTPSSSAKPGDPKRPTLIDINFKLPKGSLTMVIGTVGSGKSSIGSALIGDIEKQSGEIFMSGTIAYCPQTAWINNNTVRGNITFGCKYKKKKYNEVVRICALEPDFKTLAAGDETAIGEKGINLSGGQKARIQLARAVYSDRDIYILDDPLSAVDAHVGRIIYEECIEGRLKGKTRLLITNQLQYIDKADNIIVLEKGRIIGQGTSAQLKEKGIDFQKFIVKESKRNKKDKKEKEKEKEKEQEKEKEIVNGEVKHKTTKKDVKDQQPTKENEAETAKQIMTNEEQETNGVPWSSYLSYFLSMAPIPLLIPFTLIILTGEALNIFQQWWLGCVGSDDQISTVSFGWKIGIYAFLGLGVLIFFLTRACVSAFAVRRSNRLIHRKLITHVVHSPSSFFDTTPLGRILNRFTGDVSQTDQALYMNLMQVLNCLASLIGQIIIIAIDTPFFLYIGLPTLLIFYFVMKIYSRASRNLQRIEAISRSPVLSHFSETVTGAGLSTIRAYNLEKEWEQKFEKLNDDWSVRFIIFYEGKKWATLYSSFVSTIFMIGVILIGWWRMEPSKYAVAITAATQFGVIGIMIVQQFVELESKMTSFDRIRFYSTKLPQEKSYSGYKVKYGASKYAAEEDIPHSLKNNSNEQKEIIPIESWPQYGNVQFENISFRYRSGLPYVLNNVDFQFKGGEKIGVCGRTGAGKTSLLFALFRLIELDPVLQPTMIDVNTGFPIKPDPNEEPNKGRVLVDSIDISKVDLSRVRRSIAIIPQDPTLFTGTLRYNLDIAQRCNDDRIWEVLRMVEMSDVVADLPLGLDAQVAEGGSNFSAGQRQLICFGRVILNNCKIVVMDEATASVDVETDAKIQRTIREQFVSQTVIVIAHRLNTIMNSDRIMVMSDGKVAEIGTPINLKQNPDSAFNGLIQSLTNQ
ncbi:MAG: putative ABC transporter C family member 3 [Streblomastix strix]|uniref:Putative ABC transporter C family member 3 n=1 Tax=Streblomastix strix TaxID=222440 RepID=A0A5J4WAZ2_9EUKA|nr:MAG: putative ABC transporter C family member 3 [Streblomastix strix]